MPYADDSDKLERFDRDDAKQCQRALAAILDAASTGNLFRVTFGMTVVLDPRNELLDPAADTLELHPKLVAARDSARVQEKFSIATIKPGDVFVATGYGRIRFERWDDCCGQRTAEITLLDYGGRRNPLPQELEDRINEARAAAQHPDDLAVDRFAAVMKAKLAEKRAAGRGGWDDPKQCDVTTLARYLVEHVAKGDPVDVGNFAMMLHQRAAGPLVLPAALHVYMNPEPLQGAQ
ncbi:hypothetical protein [Burkholderia contaminans]|nr:hypothetical protein [Burkholderia contaminans]